MHDQDMVRYNCKRNSQEKFMIRIITDTFTQLALKFAANATNGIVGEPRVF